MQVKEVVGKSQTGLKYIFSEPSFFSYEGKAVDIYFINLNSNPYISEDLLTMTNCHFSHTDLCLFVCLLKELGSEHAKSQWLHLFDFSPLCVFKCALKLSAREDA